MLLAAIIATAAIVSALRNMCVVMGSLSILRSLNGNDVTVARFINKSLIARRDLQRPSRHDPA